MLDDLVGNASPEFGEVVQVTLLKGGFREDQVDENLSVITTSLESIFERPLHGVLDEVTLGSLEKDRIASEMRFTLALGESVRTDRLKAMASAIVNYDTSGDNGRGLFHDYFTERHWESAGLDQGFLVGSLDLVAQRSDGAFVIVDYKTDQIGGNDRPFAFSAMRSIMAKEHYPLQAALYAIALHRYLEGAMEGYDPRTHLGGCGYYFLRVIGDEKAAPEDGFLSWPISPDAVVKASLALGAV